ncbi:MAG: hypothetical protein N2545_02530 [Thermoflexales bacterium]|nr:hypothetical protein [Thermoflexales bacterium]
MSAEHPTSQSQPWIRASEVGEFTFCARAWWFSRVQGLPSANVEALARGVQAHRHHARRVIAARALVLAGLIALGLALALLFL